MIEKNAFKCLRCGWLWINRKEGTPFRCPHCNSTQWNVAAENVKEGYSKDHMKFPVGDLTVGEERLLPWIMSPDGHPDPRANGNRNISIKRWAVRNGQRFTFLSAPRGMTIRRVV